MLGSGGGRGGCRSGWSCWALPFPSFLTAFSCSRLAAGRWCCAGGFHPQSGHRKGNQPKPVFEINRALCLVWPAAASFLRPQKPAWGWAASAAGPGPKLGQAGKLPQRPVPPREVATLGFRRGSQGQPCHYF